ncbi:hypothetical protein HOL34_01845 [bacterium]|nr:hypothetical protein [bacterium]
MFVRKLLLIAFIGMSAQTACTAPQALSPQQSDNLILLNRQLYNDNQFLQQTIDRNGIKFDQIGQVAESSHASLISICRDILKLYENAHFLSQKIQLKLAYNKIVNVLRNIETTSQLTYNS